ncbi:MAG: endonuclease, partial [Clostridia bacterium]|nr:endonuclease [Clostridia bacterium]
MYPHYEGTWQMGQIDVDSFGSDFSFLMDTSSPTCRSLDRPYAGANPEDFQYYMIDGFIVSSDLAVEQVQTLSLDFAATDHNPVMLKVTLP